MTEIAESTLELCLAQIRAGKATVQSCLAQHPALADDLGPKLLAAQWMWGISKPALTPEGKARIEGRLLEAAVARPRQHATAHVRKPSRLPRPFILLGSTVALVIALLGCVLVSSVGETLPGSPLHEVQLTTEGTWLWLAPRSEKPKLQLRYAHRRLSELEALNEQGAVDIAAVEALAAQTEVALGSVEQLPPEKAAPLVEDLRTLIAGAGRVLSDLRDDGGVLSQDEMAVALQGQAERANRTKALIRVLPVPPSIAVAQTVLPASLSEPGGVAQLNVQVTNDGLEPVTLTSVSNNLPAEPNGQSSCYVPPEGLRLQVGETYACTLSSFLFGNAGESRSVAVSVIASDDEGNVTQVAAKEAVTFADVLPALVVAKEVTSGTIPEPAGTAQFAIRATNDGLEDLFLLSLSDDVYGDLNGRGSCALPPEGIKLKPSETYGCSFEADVVGNAGQRVLDTVTAVGADDEGNRIKASATAAVTLRDVLPVLRVAKTADSVSVPEPGGTVVFTLLVTNESVEDVLLEALQDDVHGDLTAQGTCGLPAGGKRISRGGSFSCAFPAMVEGNAGYTETDTATVVAADDEGNRVRASARTTVLVADALPVLAVSTSVEPASVPEPGKPAVFQVRVTNNSAEDLSLLSLVDNVLGDLHGQGSCIVPPAGRLLNPGRSYQCSFPIDVRGNAGDRDSHQVTAIAADDEGNRGQAAAGSVVSVSDLLPAIAVKKEAAPALVQEPGGVVQFSVRVNNRSAEEVILQSLIDEVHGDLSGRGSCLVPATGVAIQVEASFECAYSVTVSGNGGDAESSAVTAVAADDEGNRVKAAGVATVAVSDVVPVVTAASLVSSSTMPEPGGNAQFAVRVANQSFEDVFVLSLVDDLHGDLNGQGTCSVPAAGLRLRAATQASPGETYECSFAAEVLGNAGESMTNLVTVTAKDDEGNRVKASGSATVTMTDVPPAISVGKSVTPASLPEPGGTAEFSVEVTNLSVEEVTVASLIDDLAGDLNGQGTCAVPASGLRLAVGQKYSCRFEAAVLGNAGALPSHKVTAIAMDDEENRAQGSAEAALSITDLAPAIRVGQKAEPGTLSEPGGRVQFTVRVTNDSVENVVLTSLTDSLHGNLKGRDWCHIAADGVTIVPRGTYVCSFAADVAGNAGAQETNVVTAVAADDEGNAARASDRASVSIADLLPAIAVSMTADPDRLAEPGGVVDFAVRIANNSVEAVVLRSLVDDLYGDLDGRGSCSIGAGGIQIAPGAAYECSFGGDISGNAGYTEVSTVVAVAGDDEGNVTSGSGSTTVAMTDLLPNISVRASASPTSLAEPGGAVQFAVHVANSSVEEVTLRSLVDSLRGDLNGQGTCLVPSGGLPIAPGASYECAFVALVSGNAGSSVVETVTATASDDEGNETSASGGAAVSVTDLMPAIEVAETASATSLVEPGSTVQLTVRVTNSGAEVVFLSNLVDNRQGDLNTLGDCSVPPGAIALEPGAFYVCSYPAAIWGNAGESQTSSVTAHAFDDEGNHVEATASVTVVLVAPVPETG